MRELDDIIKNYLARESTNYAIFINGSWGSGKTYYWKNNLVELIGDTDVPLAPQVAQEKETTGSITKYKAFYVSLYGVKSIEEINKKLFFEIFNGTKILDSKPLKIAGGIAKCLVGIAETFGVAGNIENIKIDYAEFLQFNNRVLCFDDLERASMDIDEVLGYINNIVEHDNVKTIVIGNEEEIMKLTNNSELKLLCATQVVSSAERSVEKVKKVVDTLFEENSRFSVIKEKTIGLSVEFKPNVEEILLRILEDSTKDKTLLEILNNNIMLIKEIIDESHSGYNFRIVKYAIGDFIIIFKYINEKYKGMINRLSKPMLTLIIAASLEFKGKKDKGGLDKETLLAFGKYEKSFYYQSILAEKGDVITEFVKKYFGNNMSELLISESAIELVVKGFFDKSKFDNEIKEWIPHDLSSTDKILREYWNLSDQDFKNAIADVITGVKAGEYTLLMYTKLFPVLEYFSDNNLIDVSKDVLVGDFFDGLSKGVDKSTYNPSFEADIFLTNARSEASKRVAETAMELNNRLLVKEITADVNALINGMPDTFKELCYNLSSDKSIMWSQPVFQYLDIDALYNKIISSDNSQIISFRNCLKSRYQADNIHEFPIVNDYENIVKLKNLLNKQVENEGNELSKHLKLVLIKALDEIANKLQPNAQGTQDKKA